MAWYYDGEIRIKKLKLAPWGTNCYIIACPRTGEGVIVDTPGEANRMLAEVEGVKVKYIVITHTHPDHLGAFRKVRQQLRAPVAVHAAEAASLPSTPDIALKDGDTLKCGDLTLKVLHTPGHTVGSICLLTGRHLFAGDTLFPGGPGNTRSPEAFTRILDSITQKLLILPDETIVYPGHGDDTTIGKSKQEYAVFAGKTRKPGLYGDVLWLSS